MNYYQGQFVICKECGAARTGNIKFIKESPCPICALKRHMDNQDISKNDDIFVECPNCHCLVNTVINGKVKCGCGYEEMEVKE